MANKVSNDQTHLGHTSGFGTIEDFVPPFPPADPGPKTLTNLSDWIRKDALWKEFGQTLKNILEERETITVWTASNQ
jgi:hypothetical protein